MTSSLEPQCLADVPVRTIPFKLKMLSAMNAMICSLQFKKDLTCNRGLMNFMAQTEKASPEPIDSVSSKDITIDENTNQFVRIYTPTQQGERKKLPLIVYFHGGGFASLSNDSTLFTKMCRTFAKTANAIVVCPSYRLAPEFRCPTAYDDCFQALRWVQTDCQSGGLSSLVDPSQCFLMGDSAGGNIANNMMVKAAQNNMSPLQIKGVVLICPFFGGAERTPFELKTPNTLMLPLWLCDWFWQAYLPVGSDRNHEACNVFGPNAQDISGLSLPPVLVTIGSMDILQDWQIRYVDKMKEMGKQVKVKYCNYVHAEYTFDEPMKKVAADAAEFIQSLTC